MAGRIGFSTAVYVRNLNGIVRDHQKKNKRKQLPPAGLKAGVAGGTGTSYLSIPDTSETPV